ncbi:unnamed protein product [Thelazia callipaeda]|uniref:Secreted protein n=1 Tax=Thelazia callipaeda TaxID=103827 RepID=A0A0N5D9E7_THECL|nr:unnamed protein product [Thelazia callipaeda]
MLTSVKLFLSCYALHCFNCVSSLPSNISRDAQQAFKMILHSTYLVPPVDKLCADAQVYEFKMIKQISCSLGDQCVKISVWEKGLFEKLLLSILVNSSLKNSFKVTAIKIAP